MEKEDFSLLLNNDGPVLPDCFDEGIKKYLGIENDKVVQVISYAYDYSDKVSELSNIPLRLNRMVCDNYYYECVKAALTVKKKLVTDFHQQAKNLQIFDYTLLSSGIKADNENIMNIIVLCSILIGYDSIITDINKNINLHYGIVFDKSSEFVKNKGLADIMDQIICSKYERYQISQGYI